ncbi:MAG: M15 family metallopeptidase [Oscillospiraceae bacterium]|nr:M15 family metallopeptidase [Oscillospiraceae bacterium]
MKTLILNKENIYTGNLTLINAKNPLRNEKAASLIPADPSFPDILIQREAANILQFILDKISAENSIVPVSGYRSYAEQKYIYDESMRENGEEFTRRYVALPNHSEHQTGLAIDLGLNLPDIDFIRPEFPYEGICEKFRRTAPNYGFIERYSKDKEEITGISHEPWHFRYVGYPHSEIIAKKGFSLEEYILFIKFFRENGKYIFHGKNKTEIEIYYVPASNEKTELSLPESSAYQISGNNTDGFIVTVWRNI